MGQYGEFIYLIRGENGKTMGKKGENKSGKQWGESGRKRINRRKQY